MSTMQRAQGHQRTPPMEKKQRDAKAANKKQSPPHNTKTQTFAADAARHLVVV